MISDHDVFLSRTEWKLNLYIDVTCQFSALDLYTLIFKPDKQIYQYH